MFFCEPSKVLRSTRIGKNTHLQAFFYVSVIFVIVKPVCACNLFENCVNFSHLCFILCVRFVICVYLCFAFFGKDSTNVLCHQSKYPCSYM